MFPVVFFLVPAPDRTEALEPVDWTLLGEPFDVALRLVAAEAFFVPAPPALLRADFVLFGCAPLVPLLGADFSCASGLAAFCLLLPVPPLAAARPPAGAVAFFVARRCAASLATATTADSMTAPGVSPRVPVRVLFLAVLVATAVSIPAATMFRTIGL